ncbi:MAG: response regulator [Hyphomonadaceae bacterium]
MPGSRLPIRDSGICAGRGAGQSFVPQDDGRQAASWIRVADPRTILIVDDNDRHLDILAAILSGVGHDVETCGSGAEALRRMSSRLYEIVVLDLVMPEVGGVTVAREMRHGGYNQSTPVIVCTANALLAKRQLANVKGIHAIVPKPIDTAALVVAVANAPARQGRTDELRI